MTTSLLTIVLFFVYTWGLGFSLTRLVKESENFLERNIMRVGIGLTALIVLGVILGTLRIPIDFRIFLVASLAVPLYHLIKHKAYQKFKLPSLKLKFSHINILIVLVIFLASLFMYTSGAFKYPYLEDDDPWGHAAGAKYVSVEKTIFDPPTGYHFQYMDPYPPAYDMMFGILHQTSSSVYWTVKFFNALIISLSLLFFYFFAKEFTGSRNKALFSTFVLASIPAYLSHFIWAPALAMVVFFPAMYAFEMIKRNRMWKYLAGVGFAAVLLAHPTHAVKLGIMIIIYLVVLKAAYFLSDKKTFFKNYIHFGIAFVVGIFLSLFWWLFKFGAFAEVSKGGLRSGTDVALEQISQSSNIISKGWRIITEVFNAEGGTATRAYTLRDFFITQSANLINNPIGIGLVVSALAVLGTLAVIIKLSIQFKKLTFKQKTYSITLLLWLIFAYLGVNSVTYNLPVGLFAFRFWMVLAVPVALIAAEGLFAIFDSLKTLKLDKTTTLAIKLVIVIIIVGGIGFTSTTQKYDVNTACWNSGAFWTGAYVLEPESGCPALSETVAYKWLWTLPDNTKVFTFFNPDQVIGFDKYSCGWCQPEQDMKARFYNVTAEELNSFMIDNDYDYFIIGGLEVRRYGFNETVALMNDVGSSGLFNVAYQADTTVVFQRI
jgi:hypothetical protein